MNRLNIKNYLLPAFVFLALLIYGTIYHISSSEFWPITISKTWWTPSAFELSQLQKPLFTLLLATLHLLPLGDVAHLYAAKILFSALGALSLFYYIKNVGLVAKVSLTPYMEAILLCTLLLFSPVILHNFFRIRSDQLTFLLSMMAIYFTLKQRLLHSLLAALFIPLVSIKSTLLLLPLAFILWPHYIQYFRSLSHIWRFNLILLAGAAFIWIVGLNLGSFSYFLASYEGSYPGVYLKSYLSQEFLNISLSLASAAFFLRRSSACLRPFAFATFISILLILIVPQSLPYYIATLAPFVYLPLLIFLVRTSLKHTPQTTLMRRYYLAPLTLFLTLQAGSLLYFYQRGEILWIHKNTDQLAYLKKATQIFKRHPEWKYLDGMGILPTLPFIRCFVSPFDDASNNACRHALLSDPQPDVVIITHRLSYLGEEVFRFTEKNYIQLLPNFWVHNRHSADIKKEDVMLNNVPVPMLIFNF